ncbi:MAG: hypothetical protein AUJ82_02435 [Verrucomicrobia bacterium CG1_02_43_26]|nr:MAG: hypothetical protein AUJ82_02435 [Verrucomicrobia bacterium CG1_02_43_26]
MNSSISIGLPRVEKLDSQPKLKRENGIPFIGRGISTTPSKEELKEYSKRKQEWLHTHYPDFFLDSKLGDRLIKSPDPITPKDLLGIREASKYLNKQYELPSDILLEVVDFLMIEDVWSQMQVSKGFFKAVTGHKKLIMAFKVRDLNQIPGCTRFEKEYIDKLTYKTFTDPHFTKDINELEWKIAMSFSTETRDLNDIQCQAIKLLDLTRKDVQDLVSIEHLQAVYGLGYNLNDIRELSSDQLKFLVDAGLSLSAVKGKSRDELFALMQSRSNRDFCISSFGQACASLLILDDFVLDHRILGLFINIPKWPINNLNLHLQMMDEELAFQSNCTFALAGTASLSVILSMKYLLSTWAPKEKILSYWLGTNPVWKLK